MHFSQMQGVPQNSSSMASPASGSQRYGVPRALHYSIMAPKQTSNAENVLLTFSNKTEVKLMASSCKLCIMHTEAIK